MDREIWEYRQAVAAVVMAANLLEQFDLPKLLQEINHAETIGCFINPTLWIEKRSALREDKEMISVAIPLWNLAKKLREKTR